MSPSVARPAPQEPLSRPHERVRLASAGQPASGVTLEGDPLFHETPMPRVESLPRAGGHQRLDALSGQLHDHGRLREHGEDLSVRLQPVRPEAAPRRARRLHALLPDERGDDRLPRAHHVGVDRFSRFPRAVHMRTIGSVRPAPQALVGANRRQIRANSHRPSAGARLNGSSRASATSLSILPGTTPGTDSPPRAPAPPPSRSARSALRASPPPGRRPRTLPRCRASRAPSSPSPRRAASAATGAAASALARPAPRTARRATAHAAAPPAPWPMPRAAAAHRKAPTDTATPARRAPR